jgi:hypothetical protein
MTAAIVAIVPAAGLATGVALRRALGSDGVQRGVSTLNPWARAASIRRLS